MADTVDSRKGQETDRREIPADKRSRMEYLAGLLNRASEAYYAHDTEIMSNLEYDSLYDELRALEEEAQR